jgi:hypothetical protein
VPERRRLAEHDDEDLLGGVEGIGPVAEDPVGEPEDPVLVAAEQDVDRIAQPVGDESSDQLLVAQCLKISDPNDRLPFGMERGQVPGTTWDQWKALISAIEAW